jgi:hypothetical protein
MGAPHLQPTWRRARARAALTGFARPCGGAALFGRTADESARVLRELPKASARPHRTAQPIFRLSLHPGVSGEREEAREEEQSPAVRVCDFVRKAVDFVLDS